MSEKDVQKGYDLGYADGLTHGKLEGAEEAQERIIKLLFDEGKHSIYPSNGKQIFTSNFERLTGCGCCAELDEDWLKQLIKGEQK